MDAVVRAKLDGGQAKLPPEYDVTVRVLAPTAGPVLSWIGEALSPLSRWHVCLVANLLPCPFMLSKGLMRRGGALHPGNRSMSRERSNMGRLIGVRSLSGPP